jgi:transcriptional regulator with XRE-family HTH domain
MWSRSVIHAGQEITAQRGKRREQWERDLRKRRIRLGLRQEDIADSMGISSGTVSNVENDKYHRWEYLRRYESILKAHEQRRLEELINSYPERMMEILTNNYLRTRGNGPADGEAA